VKDNWGENKLEPWDAEFETDFIEIVEEIRVKPHISDMRWFIKKCVANALTTQKDSFIKIIEDVNDEMVNDTSDWANGVRAACKTVKNQLAELEREVR